MLSQRSSHRKPCHVGAEVDDPLRAQIERSGEHRSRSGLVQPKVMPSQITMKISEVTRRNISDAIMVEALAWSGRLDDSAFFSRLFNFSEQPSHDGRFSDAAGDIWQRRVRTYDWHDDWKFTEARGRPCVRRCHLQRFRGARRFRITSHLIYLKGRRIPPRSSTVSTRSRDRKMKIPIPRPMKTEWPARDRGPRMRLAGKRFVQRRST